MHMFYKSPGRAITGFMGH